jgi:uncharacterized protein YfaS (alpha-2-macroglobulin family)
MSRRFWPSLAIVIIAAAVLILNSTRADGTETSAIWSNGALHVTIPYRAPHAGAGTLTVEVLDPEDHVLGKSEHPVNAAAGNGFWREDVPVAKQLSLEELVWHRVRYHFSYGDAKETAVQGTESISEILRTPVVHILGQQSYLSGGTAAVRVIATDSKNEPISGQGSLRIEMTPTGQSARALYTGRLNARGTANAEFRFPMGLTGNVALKYVVDTPLGSADYTQQVRLEDKVGILLTTEKPIYQPGQTIHVRALALDRANHNASADHKLTFEVEDSRGNKVFKKATQTDKYGIASAEFALAEEVNTGTYHLRALMEGNSAEVAMNVERYVLPKFKVAVEFSGASKHGYRPGDHVTGTVRANYFFGKPVDGDVSVKASGMDVAMFEAAAGQGKMDADGAWKFDFTLPTYFAGKPLDHGAARVLVEATVKDSAGHSETRGEPITVSESPLIVTAIPEGGTLIPNLDNQVFIVTSYADGKPARTTLKVDGKAASTDDGGVAVVPLKAGTQPEKLQVEASDQEGNRVSRAVPLEIRSGEDQILLRAEKAVYRAGDRVALRVFSAKAKGTAYVDVIREGQTVLTRDLDIVNGQAELTFTATAALAGTLDCNAYLFGKDARPVGDHRLLFVQPADELKIEATADGAVYKPGDEARIRFHVTNGKGEGVQAALGLQVVDEAVFALAEKQPGFAKVFFYLEQEAMKPRYEIHSIGMPEVVEPVALARGEQRDRAARALFAATEMAPRNRFETEFGRAVPATKFWEYRQKYQDAFMAQVRAFAKDGSTVSKPGPIALRDAWGSEMRVEQPQWIAKTQHWVRSAGPDKRFDTGDDLIASVQARTGRVVRQPGPEGVAVDIEHDRGPFNGLAQIAGSVVDPVGAAIPGATISVREVASGKTRTARSNADGQFSLAGLPPAEYELRIETAGFRSGSSNLSLKARDRAVVSANLQVGAVKEEAVEVAAVGVGGGVGGGFGRGIGAGVMGGIAGNLQDQRMEAMRMPAAAPRMMALNEPVALASKAALPVSRDAVRERDDSAAPRVRSYFPEALYINPEIITDGHGNATISIPMADSITTWRMAMVASTMRGALGTGSSSIKVFQDFFTDLDLPVTLTQGDRVSIPVAVYNYSGGRGDVSLKLQPSDWFELVNDTPDKNVAVESGKVGGAQFTIEAKRIGKFKLTLAANMIGGVKRADIVVREIEVIPNGREQNITFNGRLETSVEHAVNFPPMAVPDAGKIFVRLYPGPLSQVIEGMDAILRMPGGCFEQTSSSTYPNVLALDYMKRMKKLTPEVHAKAEGFISNGYQRLLTFEVPGGGFSWFGQAPANKILTSYGLMEFSDMSKVHDVDPRLIQRTQQWLAGQQQGDGSWKPDTNFINEGATNRYNTDLLRITAYIAWALENTGYQGPAVAKATQFVQKQMGTKSDAYTLAVVANFAVESKDRDFARQAIQALLDAHTEKDDQAWWTAEETGMYGRGASASVETTGLAVQALLKWGQASAVAQKALTYIASKKDASGTWGTTQATIMALRAVLLSTEKGAADMRGTVEITLNGKPADKLTLTADNNDLYHQIVLKGVDSTGPNTVALRFDGKGALAYQIAGRFFLPWAEKPANEPMSITVSYDRTQLSQNDVATATATVKNNLDKTANMVMVDLGIPPGFDLLSEDLQDMQTRTAGQKGGRLEKFSQTATQAILYFDSFGPGQTVTVKYRLRAKYPIRARTFQSRVYEYYDPDVNAVARPVQLEVKK